MVAPGGDRPSLAMAYSRRGLHGQVVDALGTRILAGGLKPGDPIDSEAIEAEFGVSRTLVREVLKVLTAKGLVDAKPRLGTFVRDRASWNLLDADVMCWRTCAGNVDPRLLLELGEVRAIVEPGAAALAAARRSPAQLERIRVALTALERYPGLPTAESIEADVDFHLGILDAAGNELMLRFEVMMVPAMRARNAVAMRPDDQAYLGQHRLVYEAIEASDPAAAEQAMRWLLESAAKDAARALGLSEAEGVGHGDVGHGDGSGGPL